jgi:hypothetical protein
LISLREFFIDFIFSLPLSLSLFSVSFCFFFSLSLSLYLSLSISLSHTHTHTHTLFSSLSVFFLSLSLFEFPVTSRERHRLMKVKQRWIDFILQKHLFFLLPPSCRFHLNIFNWPFLITVKSVIESITLPDTNFPLSQSL